MSLNSDETREQERSRQERRENIAFGILVVIGLAGVAVALIAATSHGVPTWLVVVGFIGGALVFLPAVAFAWLAIYTRSFEWAVKKPLATLKTVVQKDDALAVFTIIIGPVQALIFFVSNEIIEDKRLKIATGLVVGALSIMGGISATLAKNRRMYFFGAGAVVLSLVPILVAACDYQRWIGGFGHLGIFGQAAIVSAFVSSILVLIFVISSWPQVAKGPLKENLIQPDTSKGATTG